MKGFARNIEILLLNHDLVMVPGLGGFLANYQQAQFDDDEQNILLPPARYIVFNKDLNSNDGLMVHAYMHNYDATYPQALRQLELDVEEINDILENDGFVILDNVGTLHKNIDGVISFEQIHSSIVTPQLFALPSIRLSNIEELQNDNEIKEAIAEMSNLPVVKSNTLNEKMKIWRDVAISSAAAVALFFMFVFPHINNQQDDKIVAGSANDRLEISNIKDNDNLVRENGVIEKDLAIDNNITSQTQTTQPQIILLQTPQQSTNALILSQNDLDKAEKINSQDGDYTIVVSAAANEECALYVIGQLNDQNIPGAYYHEGNDGKFIFYSSFASAIDAQKTLNALKQVNSKFKRAWVRKI